MIWKATIGLLAALAIAACGGGSSGTGISTAQGNVASVDETALRSPSPGGRKTFFARLSERFAPKAAIARNSVEGIRVTVERTSFSDVTDANGLFAVRGSFAGPVTLVFDRSDDGVRGRLGVTIPSGGTVTLSDIRIESASGQATPRSQTVEFDGQVTAKNCSELTVTVTTRSGHGPNQSFTVRLGGATIRDEEGQAGTCGDLLVGDRVEVEGSQRPDGTVDARTLEVEDRPGDPSEPSEEAS